MCNIYLLAKSEFPDRAKKKKLLKKNERIKNKKINFMLKRCSFITENKVK